jgi:HD-like signal output (HDOD) protein
MDTQVGENGKQVVADVLASLGELATLPEVTAKIIAVVEDPNGTARQLEEVIKRDPTLSARVLKVINSAFYGLPGQVDDLNRAIVLLGRSGITNIAIAVSLSHMFKDTNNQQIIGASALWRHSLAVAVVAKKMAVLAHCPAAPDQIFMAGLIHDLGLIMEWQALPAELAAVCHQWVAGEGDFLQLEREIIGATHQDFGYALTAAWRFPDRLRAAVGQHHDLEGLSGESLDVTAVLRDADTLCCRAGIGFCLTAHHQNLDAKWDEPADGVATCPDTLAGASLQARILDGLDGEIEEAQCILGLAD